MLQKWLAHPLTRGLSIDDPQTTELRRRIIREKPFLRKIYEEWYRGIASVLPDGDEPVLELGSGGGFLKEFVPGLVTSEVSPCPGVDLVVDARSIPFPDQSLRAIVMTDVLHHIASPRAFFREAHRTVRAGGAIVMVEPWVTSWSRIIYRHLHHEPFRPDAAEWEFPADGPLSGANGALPWIIFERDRGNFEEEFPGWRIRAVKQEMPFSYLMSGGVSLRSLMPGFTYRFWRSVERVLGRWGERNAMFARIELVRADDANAGGDDGR